MDKRGPETQESTRGKTGRERGRRGLPRGPGDRLLSVCDSTGTSHPFRVRAVDGVARIAKRRIKRR
eukprot:scaffold2933_cov31-Tisochrysis_lutea.AAC.1